MQWSLLTSASVALAGCAAPPHQVLVSQLDLPEFRLPGEARWYATTCQECEGGCGVAVRIMDGRAKKIEGIPAHPVSHGKICARGHSALQALYNPDRLTSPQVCQGNTRASQPDWKSIEKTLASQLNGNPGETLWITPPLYGTLGALILALAEKVRANVWILDFPGSKPERAAMKKLTGRSELPYYEIEKADFIVNFGSDFLMTGHSAVRDGWAYGEFRQGKNRSVRGTLVSFSPRMNVTVANSDQWIPIPPGTEGWVAAGLGNLLSEGGEGKWLAWSQTVSLPKISQVTGVPEETFRKLAEKLRNAKHPLAMAGLENGMYTNGAESIQIIQRLNHLLTGKLSIYEPNLLVSLPGTGTGKNHRVILDTQESMAKLESGKFRTVWVMEVNPRYLLPSKFQFDHLFSQVKNKVVFSPYLQETGLMADLVVPTASWLESWGDRLLRISSGDQTETLYNLQQPVVLERPGSRSLGDLLLQILKESKGSLTKELPWESLQEILRKRFPAESDWETALARAGTWKESPLNWELYQGKGKSGGHPLDPPPALTARGKSPKGVNLWDSLSGKPAENLEQAAFSGKGQILLPFLSPALADGSLANRPWMQELADPITTVVWSHWVELPTALANQLGVRRGEIVRLTSEAGSLEGPAFPNPGLHPEAVAVPVGQGHVSYGQYADRGENPLSILSPHFQKETGEIAWVSTRVNVEKTGKQGRLTTMDGRVNALRREVLPQ